ncbi:hypothetical protein M9H77_26018 [Catharanthus roseus]|uniref:Uncharacterized protein n=1 Tax=Catharanthus roseus TaxID=4058 RepID=A0ACC0AA24_CATRO|nr:hypothetical protein M9H77_26018 [Catharanthus roseus]
MGHGLNHVKGSGCLEGQGKHSDKGYDGPEKHIGGSIFFTESLTKKKRFHEVKRKTDEETETTGTTMPDDFDVMTILAGGVNHGLDTTRLEAAHLKAKSNRSPSCRGLTPIKPCYAEKLRRDNLVYILPLPMLDLIRAAMGIGASISSLSTPAADSEVPILDVLVRSSSTPSPSICGPSDLRTDQDV